MAQQKGNLLVALPILACPQRREVFKKECRFLEQNYILHFYDPLEQVGLANFSFSQWLSKQQIDFMQWANCFDAYLGFSLGGMLLVRLFSIFDVERPLVLLSTPQSLKGGLCSKIDLLLMLLGQGWVSEASILKNYYVFAPESASTLVDLDSEQMQNAQDRLYQGLFFVKALAQQGLPELKPTFLSYYGSESLLVNSDNVYQTHRRNCIPVYQSGMRVLSQGSQQIHQDILHFLRSAV